MVESERIYTIPLRKVVFVPRKMRSPYAIKLIKTFVSRHMKVPFDNVWIDSKVNEFIWQRGREKPPRKITVRVVKFEEEEIAEVHLSE